MSVVCKYKERKTKERKKDSDEERHNYKISGPAIPNIQ